MTLAGTFAFAGPRAVVWELLHDADVLKQAMPGARRFERTGDGRYEGVMKVGLGPVTAAEFTVTVMLGAEVPPERFTMTIDSKGGLGFTRGSAQVRLDETDDGAGTLMTYASDLQIGGRIAGVGQRVVESAARMMTEKGLQALQRALDERLSGRTEPPT